MGTEIFSNIQVINVSKQDRVEVLTEMAQKVVDAGYAKPEFIDAVIKREEVYPTGLHTQGVEVAIPHADPEWTIQPSMCVGLLKDAVDFEPMGGEGSTVKAGLIFMLTIADPSEHLEFLQAFATVMEDGDTLSKFEASGDINVLLNKLKNAS